MTNTNNIFHNSPLPLQQQLPSQQQRQHTLPPLAGISDTAQSTTTTTPTLRNHHTRTRTTSISIAAFAPSTSASYDPHSTNSDSPLNLCPNSHTHTLPSIIDPISSPSLASPSYPRRRVSVSVSAAAPSYSRSHSHNYNNYMSHTAYPIPSSSATTQSRPRRARTMSYPIRATRHNIKPSSNGSSTKTRKIVISLLVILFLFLLGTIIVLSSVSYFLAIPSWAYLTEGEVTWRPQDTIKQLRDEPVSELNATLGQITRPRVRALTSSEVDVEGATDPVLGTEALPAVWKELEEEMEQLDAEEESDESPEYHSTSVIVNNADADDKDVWGINGEGTGGYWMKKDWDGTVQGTDSWERLFNVTTRPGETIPRLIHQTWKNDQLPEKWRKAWKECREGMPDYEYMLWTDEMSREFIATHYPAHLHMFDTYKYPIQRADSIRYFILHHFGGVYMDLDIGCRRRLDSLLQGDWEVILPITKPVGVSNDLIFSSKGSAFMDDTVHGLSAFNHQYMSNYPTVMFSTGPMFLSAQYSLYSSGHPLTENHARAEVRILPKSLYGKNAPVLTVPHAFFSHFYGSSWHSDDAGFITFLGAWGKKLMWVGAVVIVLGVGRLVWLRRSRKSGQQYHLLSILPTSAVGSGSRGGDETPTSPTSSTSPMSPSTSFELNIPQQLPHDIASVFKRAGNLILAAPATLLHGGDRRRRRTGLLYFVPALFQPGPVPRSRGRTASEASQLPLRRTRRDRAPASARPPPPPPYERVITSSPQPDAKTGLGLGMGGGGRREPTMEDVDAFLAEGGSTEGSSYLDDEEEEEEVETSGVEEGEDQEEWNEDWPKSTK